MIFILFENTFRILQYNTSCTYTKLFLQISNKMENTIVNTAENNYIADTIQIIYKKSNKFFLKKSNSTKYKIRIKLLSKIKEFSVRTYFQIEKIKIKNKINWKLSFKILNKKLFFDDGTYHILFEFEKKYVELSPNNIKSFIEIVKNLITNIKFNKLSGFFESDGSNIDYSNVGDCCICYDKTMTKTTCNHHMCIECWCKITNKNECPYCRTTEIKISK